jgi:hypothetical protein
VSPANSILEEAVNALCYVARARAIRISALNNLQGHGPEREFSGGQRPRCGEVRAEVIKLLSLF